MCVRLQAAPEQMLSVMQGNVEVAKEIKYADKEVYLPWRPR